MDRTESNLIQFEFELISNQNSSKLKQSFKLKRRVWVWFGTIQSNFESNLFKIEAEFKINFIRTTIFNEVVLNITRN